MEAFQGYYFSTYRSLKLTRDAKGVLVAELHSNGGPCTFTARSRQINAGASVNRPPGKENQHEGYGEHFVHPRI
jgi:hypothetical protein